MSDIKISPYNNLLEYQKGYTSQIIEEIILEHVLDGLRIFDDLDPVDSIDFLNECGFLRKLSISTVHDFGFKYLFKMPNLSFLHSGVRGNKSLIDLRNQINLENLILQWQTNTVGFEKCKKLKNLVIWDFKEKNLLKIKGATNLEILHIKTSSIKSLEGIENLANLKKLCLGNCRRLKSIKAINGLKNLEEIDLDSCSNIQDYASLTQLPAFKKLFLWSSKTIDSFKFLNNFPALEQVGVRVNAIDGDISPLKRIKRLNYNHLKHYNEKVPTPWADELAKINRATEKLRKSKEK
jgi:Leucine-rich repeat (LRR) protein